MHYVLLCIVCVLFWPWRFPVADGNRLHVYWDVINVILCQCDIKAGDSNLATIALAHATCPVPYTYAFNGPISSGVAGTSYDQL